MRFGAWWCIARLWSQKYFLLSCCKHPKAQLNLNDATLTLMYPIQFSCSYKITYFFLSNLNTPFTLLGNYYNARVQFRKLIYVTEWAGVGRTQVVMDIRHYSQWHRSDFRKTEYTVPTPPTLIFILCPFIKNEYFRTNKKSNFQSWLPWGK